MTAIIILDVSVIKLDTVSTMLDDDGRPSVSMRQADITIVTVLSPDGQTLHWVTHHGDRQPLEVLVHGHNV